MNRFDNMVYRVVAQGTQAETVYGTNTFTGLLSWYYANSGKYGALTIYCGDVQVNDLTTQVEGLGAVLAAGNLWD